MQTDIDRQTQGIQTERHWDREVSPAHLLQRHWYLRRGGRRSDMTVASLDGQLLDSCNHMLRWTPHKLTTMSPQLIKQLIVGRRNSSLTRLFKDINYAQLFANNTFLDAHIMYYIWLAGWLAGWRMADCFLADWFSGWLVYWVVVFWVDGL